MRKTWIYSLVALAVSARPLSEDQAPKPLPNDVNILGGDFGLADSRVKVELYSMLSKTFTGSGGPSSSNAVAAFLTSLLTAAGLAEAFDSLGGNMLGWLSSQFAFWMVGTDSDDPTTFICRAFEPESMLSGIFRSVFGGVPSRPGEKCDRDYSGGTGPYKANYTVDPSLPNRTIYAPIQSPKDVAMPVIVWGGGCLASGLLYANFLTEIASHGYLAIVTGRPANATGGTAISEMTQNVDWATNNEAVKKYGNIDRTKIIAAGHSCGGLEALSGTYRDSRIMMSLLFNSGVQSNTTREKLKLLNKPVAYFEGAPKLDYTYESVSRCL
jgi:Chlorophyllase enzyme